MVNNGRDMARHHARASLLLLLCLVALFGGSGAFADAIVLPPVEAPTTIFATKLGSVDVDLSLLGSWTAGASFGAGLLFAPGVPVQALDSFPSMDQGFVFSQTPDITISLLLLKRFFLNVSVLGDFTNNFIQLGYKGGPSDVLRSVVLGTQGIAIPPSPLLQIPDQPKGSLGAMAQLVSGNSTNNLLLRWDAASRKTKTFIGKHELVEQEIGIDTYMRGRHFFLPDIGLDNNSLQVFLEDASGTYISSDSRRYRLATYDEVAQDSSLGTVYLRNTFKARVLVHYKRGLAVGFAAGTPGLPDDALGKRNTALAKPFNWGITYFGHPMTDRRVNLPGVGDCLLLWEPGDNSPFEIGSSYAFSSEPPADVSKISIKLNAKVASATLPTNLIFQTTPSDKRFMALVDLNLASPTNRFKNFLPFDDPKGLLYGPNRDSLQGGLDFDIIYQFLTPVTDMVLEANIVPGSVQVTVNGLSETRFQVDAASGRLTLLADVRPTDRIVVTYSKVEQGTSGGDILFAWTDRIEISDAANLSFSAGIRWNANPWSYTQVPYAKSGTIIAAAGIDGKTDTLSYSAQAAVAYTNPDTTGILRLFGMEGNSTQLDLSEDNVYPASAPADPTPFAPLTPTQSNRGVLWYRDFRIYGALGATALQTFEEANPPQMPYADGKRMGPFNVLGSNGNLGKNSLVTEYSLNNNEWVGAQLPISSGSDVDLSGARALTIRIRNPNWSGGPVNVSLQIGSISEDLDSTGVLKAEVSSTDTGFPFVDQAHPGVTLKVGAGPQLTGNGRLDSEDRNANAILDFEDANRIVSAPTIASIPLNAANPTWKNYTFTLTDTDRQKLLKARAVRIIITNTSGGVVSGDLLIDTVSIEGTPFWPVPGTGDSRDDIHVREVSENIAQSQPSGGDFASRFPDTYRKFHSAGETNEVLETSWNGPLITNNVFTVQGFVPQGTGGIQYDTIVSYIRSPTAGVTYTFSLWDNTKNQPRISWTIPSPNNNDWHEIKVSRKENTVLMDGNEVGSLITFEAGYGSLAQLKVQVSGAVASTGYLYIDEVYCTDPQGDFGAAFVGSLNARIPGILIKAGNVPVLSDMNIREDVSLMTAGFSPLYGTPSPAEDLSSQTQVDATLLTARTTVNLNLRETAGAVSASGGHRIAIPSLGIPVSFTDAFALNLAGGFSRENIIALTPGPFLSVALDTSAKADADETPSTGQLTQSWQGTVSSVPFSPLSLSTSLSVTQAVTGYILPQEWYGARWAREAALVVPWAGGSDVLRSEQLDFKAGIPASPFGFSFEAQGGASGTSYSPTLGSFTQENDAALSLQFLLKLGQGDSSDSAISLGYRRQLSVTTAPSLGPRFSAETAEFGRILSLQGYMLQSLPFAELFSDNSGKVLPAWINQDGSSASLGTYSPSVNVTLQRGYGSHILDLLVPSSIDVSFGQDLRKTTDLTQTRMFIRPKTTTRAVNLFGELGAYPLLPGVRTDEYSLSLSGSVDGGPGLPTILSSLSAEAYASLTGTKESEFTFVETFRRDQSTTVTLSNSAQALLDWTVRPKGGVQLPLIRPEIGETAHLLHRESAEIISSYSDTGAFHPFTFILGHATSLIYEGHGSIKASVNLGLDAENLGAAGIAWRLAVRAALEAKLTF